MTNTNTTQLEQLNQSLAELERELGEFLTFILDPETTDPISAKLHGGRFGIAAIEARTVGYYSDKLNAHVVYGDLSPNGNAEGSFYVHHGRGLNEQYGKRIQLRWAGDCALYLNGPGNYVRFIPEYTEGAYQVKVQPSRIDGRSILAIEETGVRTQHPDKWKRDAIDRAANTDNPITYLDDPGPVADIIVPLTDLIEMIDGMREGLDIGRKVVDELIVG